MRPWSACLAVFWGLFIMGTARADPMKTAPLATCDRNPFVAVTGLPASGNSAVQPPGVTEIRIGADAASDFYADTASGETLVLDGETWRFHISARRGLAQGVELGVDVPYVCHGGGIFDGAIDLWHDVSGLPSGGREDFQNDRLDYRYSRDSRTLTRIDETTSGIGDVILSLAFRLGGNPKQMGRHFTLRTGVKLPTGSPENLTGSGAAGGYASISSRDDERFAAMGITLYGSGGMLWAGKSEVAGNRQHRAIGFGSLGAAWRATGRCTPKVQVDWHSPVYRHSALKKIGAWSAQLALGGTISLCTDAVLDVAIVEDVIVDTAPDVVFHILLRKRFH